MGARIQHVLFVILLAAAASTPLQASEGHRQLGAHEHGRGTLNVAVEGSKVTMELEVPGADIVGFEHPATTKEQKAAVETAKARLLAPFSLFGLSASSGCRLTEANVEVESGGHEGDATEAKGTKSAQHTQGHSEFHAQYAFECQTPSRLTAIEFGYFHAFAGAQKLEVNVITPKGQTKFEVTRASPNLSLAGMI